MPLYVIRIEIYEASTYDYPIVTHLFTGRTREEARGYHEAHRRSDTFLRQCEDQGLFHGNVRCWSRLSEGWSVQ